MIGIRHEKYEAMQNSFPFQLGADLKRTAFHCAAEQNWHENLEIQLVTEGEGKVLLNGEAYPIKKGTIVVVNSNVIHYTCTDSALTYTVLILGTDWCKQMGINYDALQFSPILKSEKLQKLILELAEMRAACADALFVAKSNQLLLQIMIELAENHAAPARATVAENKRFDVIKEVIAFIQKNYSRKITLDEIAKTVFFDKYALCREFKKYTGQTIVESLNQYRCVRATHCLTAGKTVAETATLCGFENLSFFTKTFKKYMGKAPSAYKEK